MHILHVEIDHLFDVELDSYEQDCVEFQQEFTFNEQIVELEFE